jgi:DNA-binding IclR family transcriptional regulator
MAAKSCRKIEVLMAADAILNTIAGCKEPIGIPEIAKSTNLTNDSVFRQLGTMSELRWVEKIGDGYVLGMFIATIWARKKSMIEGDIERATRDLKEITGGEAHE